MSDSRECLITVDAGGTALKWALIRHQGPEKLSSVGCPQAAPVDSGGSAESIIETFRTTIQRAFVKADKFGLEVIGIGISTPGPFNLKDGIPLMTHKYQAVYGVNLREVLIRELGLTRGFPIRFEYDMDAFLLGEARYGAARGYHRIIGITLGTGLGSSFLVEGRFVQSGPGVPPEGALWCQPWGGGIADDVISHRGLLASYDRLGGEPLGCRDVRSISVLAQRGNRIGLQAFQEFGETLGKILWPVAIGFQADCIVFGGQISKSYPLFAAPLEKEMASVASLKKVSPGELIDSAPLLGVARRVLTAGGKINHEEDR